MQRYGRPELELREMRARGRNVPGVVDGGEAGLRVSVAMIAVAIVRGGCGRQSVISCWARWYV